MQNDRKSSEPFEVTNGSNMAVMAPTVFRMMFPAMLINAFHDHSDMSFRIRYRFDGNLFILRRLQAKT